MDIISTGFIAVRYVNIAELLALRRYEEFFFFIETTEMRMLWRIKCVTIRDKERSDEIRRDLGVENIALKVRQARLRWCGHNRRMDEENNVKQTMKMEVRGTRAKEDQELRGWTTSGMILTSEVWRRETPNRWRRWLCMVNNLDLAS